MARSETRQPEKKLRGRIRKAFAPSSGGTRRPTVVENLVVDLVNKYATAPKDFRESIYREGERRILHAARKTRG